MSRRPRRSLKHVVDVSAQGPITKSAPRKKSSIARAFGGLGGIVFRLSRNQYVSGEELATKVEVKANHTLALPIAHQMYLPTPVVFTTGVADAGDHYIVASGEADLACRLTHMPKALFA
jgi:hypothetical protein